MRKVGLDYRRDILKDKRLYANDIEGGPEVMRNAQTWREAHRILVEIEAISSGTKALVNAIDSGPGLTPKKPKKPQKPHACA